MANLEEKIKKLYDAEMPSASFEEKLRSFLLKRAHQGFRWDFEGEYLDGLFYAADAAVRKLIKKKGVFDMVFPEQSSDVEDYPGVCWEKVSDVWVSLPAFPERIRSTSEYREAKANAEEFGEGLLVHVLNDKINLAELDEYISSVCKIEGEICCALIGDKQFTLHSEAIALIFYGKPEYLWWYDCWSEKTSGGCRISGDSEGWHRHEAWLIPAKASLKAIACTKGVWNECKAAAYRLGMDLIDFSIINRKEEKNENLGGRIKIRRKKNFLRRILQSSKEPDVLSGSRNSPRRLGRLFRIERDSVRQSYLPRQPFRRSRQRSLGSPSSFAFLPNFDICRSSSSPSTRSKRQRAYKRRCREIHARHLRIQSNQN